MEGPEQGETRMCDNCQKSFPEQKIDLHEAYCRRNIKKCNKCFQMYDINDQEGHEKQFHSKKDCQHCGQSFPEKEWEVHQPSCKRRPLKCTYCDNDVAYQQIIRHQQSCGSRTTKCEICKKFIALRQFDVHKLSCIQKQPSPRIEERALSRDEIRNYTRQYPTQIHRMNSDEERGRRQNFREYRPYEELNRRHHDRNSNQRLHVLSQDKPKPSGNLKPTIRIPHTIKPSHIIEPQKIREFIDPVPISIRLAMGRMNNKPPLQNRN